MAKRRRQKAPWVGFKMRIGRTWLTWRKNDETELRRLRRGLKPGDHVELQPNAPDIKFLKGKTARVVVPSILLADGLNYCTLLLDEPVIHRFCRFHRVTVHNTDIGTMPPEG